MGDWRGVAVSVHARAVNLLLEDGPFIALLPAGAPLHPWALTVTLSAADLARTPAGAGVCISGGSLDVGAVKVELAGLEVVDLRLRLRLRSLNGAAVRRLLRSAPGRPGAGPFEATLAAALDRFRSGGDIRDLATLVGVGEGLTPSGDDVLVGVLAGLDAARAARRCAAALRARLCAALERGDSRTTRLSAQMLDAAAAGLYAEPVLGVLQALASGDSAAGAPEPAVAALLAVGHRSGADTLRGIVAALERLMSG